MKTRRIVEFAYGGVIYGAFVYYIDNNAISDSYEIVRRGANLTRLPQAERREELSDQAWADLNQIAKAKIAQLEGRL